MPSLFTYGSKEPPVFKRNVATFLILTLEEMGLVDLNAHTRAANSPNFGLPMAASQSATLPINFLGSEAIAASLLSGESHW
jgi:hypothetical protein